MARHPFFRLIQRQREQHRNSRPWELQRSDPALFDVLLKHADKKLLNLWVSDTEQHRATQYSPYTWGKGDEGKRAFIRYHADKPHYREQERINRQRRLEASRKDVEEGLAE